jgi:hypothetical protein
MNSQFPSAAAIATRLDAHFNNLATSPVVLPDDGTMYGIEANFGTRCKSWKGILQTRRFGRTTETNILYRSQIVDKLHAMADATLYTPNTGIMVRGPQGIGKSHTLVNLVLKLQSTGNYLVTFVPNCDKLDSSDFLLKVICDSFGIDVYGTEGLNRLTPTNGPTPPIQVHELEEVIEAILDHLQSISKAWVFVFDQISSPFARQPGATKISHLGYPERYIENVMREGVISIISASANNEISMIESHEAFEAFEHSSIMSDEELMAAFGDIDLQGVIECAGRVPLYVKKFLALGETEFHASLKREMFVSFESMKANAHRWPEQQKSIISCVLQLESDAVEYDRKYLLCELSDTGSFTFKPLYPAVIQAYRSLLWNEIMEFVHQKESSLLDACKSGVGGSAIGQLYEYMVIQRIRSSGLKIPWINSSVHIKPSAGQQHFTMFPGKVLPSLPSRDGVWVPLNSNFTAIDFFIKSGNNVIGVQVHVSTHDDVTENFFDLCEDAGWFDAVPGSEIGLVYLSPTKTTTKMVKKLVDPEVYPDPDPNSRKRKRVDPRMRRGALASSSIKGLETIGWS